MLRQDLLVQGPLFQVPLVQVPLVHGLLIKRVRRPGPRLPRVITEAHALAHGAAGAGEFEGTGLAAGEAAIDNREATANRNGLTPPVRTGLA